MQKINSGDINDFAQLEEHLTRNFEIQKQLFVLDISLQHDQQEILNSLKIAADILLQGIIRQL